MPAGYEFPRLYWAFLSQGYFKTIVLAATGNGTRVSTPLHCSGRESKRPLHRQYLFTKIDCKNVPIAIIKRLKFNLLSLLCLMIRQLVRNEKATDLVCNSISRGIMCGFLV